MGVQQVLRRQLLTRLGVRMAKSLLFEKGDGKFLGKKNPKTRLYDTSGKLLGKMGALLLCSCFSPL